MGKKQLELLMAVLILAGAFCVGRLGAQMRQMRREITTAISRNTGEQMVVIDAGHGGFDSGKVGINGVMEKDTKQEKLSYVQRYPQAINFDEKHLKQFIKEYKQLPSVIKNQISSIVFEPNDKDQTKCKLELDDGKIFYVRIEDMVRQLTSTNYYLVTQKYPENKYYDFLGKNVYVYN